MQNNESRERIKAMGAPAERVSVTGNMKFDTAVRASLAGRLDTDAIKNDLGLTGDRPLFIAGSTHRPEEGIILRVYRGLLKESPDLSLLLAPRHIERVREIENIVRRSGFTPVRTSGIAGRRPAADKQKPAVLILDTMGRLSQLFSIGTIIFMGGSLMRKGGQNILEPAVFSKPILFGPHMFNFKDIAEAFLSEGAACMVKDEAELFKTAGSLLKDLGRIEELGRRAKSLIEKNRGATERNYERIRIFIDD